MYTVCIFSFTATSPSAIFATSDEVFTLRIAETLSSTVRSRHMYEYTKCSTYLLATWCYWTTWHAPCRQRRRRLTPTKTIALLVLTAELLRGIPVVQNDRRDVSCDKPVPLLLGCFRTHVSLPYLTYSSFVTDLMIAVATTFIAVTGIADSLMNVPSVWIALCFPFLSL